MKRFCASFIFLALSVASLHAQDLSTRNIIFRSGTTRSTLTPPSTGGPFFFTLPPSDGTLLVNPNPSLGGAGMVYSTPAAQDTATQNRYLFNVQYGNVAAGPLASVGARISSSSIGPSNATALTLEAIAGAGAVSRGVTISASGGGTNVAIEVTSGSIVSGGAVQLTALPAGANTDDIVTIDGTGNVRRTAAATVVGGAAWLLGGNATVSTQTFGTTSNQAIAFATNGVTHFTITAAGGLIQEPTPGAQPIVFNGHVSINHDIAFGGITHYVPIGNSVINGSTGGSILCTGSFVKQLVTSNTSGTTQDAKLTVGSIDGQKLFMRLAVNNTAGTGAIRLLNSDNTVLEVINAGQSATRFYELLYSTDDGKWMLFASIAP